MGLLPGLDPIPGPHADAIDHIRQIALARGVPVGMPCAGAARALELADAGFPVLPTGRGTRGKGTSQLNYCVNVIAGITSARHVPRGGLSVIQAWMDCGACSERSS